MVGLVFIAVVIGLWLLVAATGRLAWLYDFIDLSPAQLVFGDSAVRWLYGVFGAMLLLIGMLGVLRLS